MKKLLNKKGFTLIELLAVIVVLGIILAIAIPLVTGSINDSKKGSFKSSAEMVLKEISKQHIMATSMGSSVSGKAIPSACVSESVATCNFSTIGYTASQLGLTDDYSMADSRVWIADEKINVLLCATNGAGKFNDMGTDTSGAVSGASGANADCVHVQEQ